MYVKSREIAARATPTEQCVAYDEHDEHDEHDEIAARATHGAGGSNSRRSVCVILLAIFTILGPIR